MPANASSNGKSPAVPASGTAQSEYKSFHYQAGSWTLPRRVVAKVEHHAGELFPRVGFVVTNLQLPSRAVVRFYNKRGTAEQWIKEGKQAAHWTRLSCHRFRGVGVRRQLSVLAYILGNLWRAPQAYDHWSLTSVQQRLVKIETRAVPLAAAGGEPPDTAPVRGDARRVADPSELTVDERAKNGGERKSTGMERCPRNAVEPS